MQGLDDRFSRDALLLLPVLKAMAEGVSVLQRLVKPYSRRSHRGLLFQPPEGFYPEHDHGGRPLLEQNHPIIVLNHLYG